MGAPASLFTAHSVQIETAGGTSAWIDQVQEADLDLGIELFEESGSGESDREQVAVRSRENVLRIGTSDLAFLATCGLSGIHVAADADDPGMVAWGKSIPQGGIRDAIATAAHLKLAMSDGLIIPVSLEGSHNRIARLMVEAHAKKGTGAQSGTHPFVITKDSAITSGGQTSAARYVAGVVKYNSGGNKLVTGIKDISVRFGIGLIKESSDAEIDISHIAILSRNPVIEFTTIDGELLDDVGESGAACTSFAVYFQKVAANGDRVAKGTGEHISIIATSGLLIPVSQGTPHNNAGEGRYRFTPVKDTNLFTIATNATIPTT